jgi:CHAT domain-containing protein
MTGSHAAGGWYALPVLAVVLSTCGGQESLIERSVRQASLAYPRPVEGRLSVAGRFASWDESPAAHRHDPTPFSDGEDKRVLRGSRPLLGNRDPEELHRIGLLFLYHGAEARAVSALEAAAERKPSAAILSDLAAAYLALSNDDQPWLLVDAIAAATRSIEQAAGEPYAAFNLALALERMSLVHESSLAWERYLTLDDADEWRQEASERLARLRAATTHDRWEAEKKLAVSAAAAGDKVTLSRLARQFPRQIKELLEADLFLAWAEAAGTPTEGARLSAAKSVAETLANSGELLYADAIRVISGSGEGSSALADGHRAYARGLALHGDCLQAMPEFERALDRFSASRSPMVWAARFQHLVCAYRRRAADAEGPLAKLASELEAHSYPTLLARTEAMLGLCAMARGGYSQAIPHYERAVQLLTGSGDSDILNLLGMLDEAYRFLGDQDRAWRYRLESLRGAVAAGDRKIRHSILAGLARDLVEKDRREAAHLVLDEMLANAQAWSEAGATAEALLRRIQLYLLSGSGDEATADIAECARVLEQYRQPADREHLTTELMVESAEQQLATSPTGALKTLQAALARLDTNGDDLLLPKLLLDLARTHVALGNTAAAEENFDRALQIYETRRKGTDDERLRISFFSTAQASFDAMIRFQALERGDAHAAFAYSERVHARALRDHLEAGNGAAESLLLDEQLDRIPLNVSVIAYVVLPDALLIWQLRQGSLKMHVLPATRREVAEVVDSLRSTLIGGASSDTGNSAAARAFDVLLRPALRDLPAGTELVFVPDRELHQVPFAALFDASRRRYLIEDHTCLVAPSLESYATSLKHHPSAFRSPGRVLAVGNPAFDRERFPTLPDLPYARQEAFEVASLYKDSLLLTGHDATRQRILDGLQRSDVLHLAAHVMVDPRNPLGSFVATADLGRSPLRASDLDAERLAGVELVFLSACETAPGFADGDREGVAGLARAFLAAGVPSVAATLWSVDDQTAGRLAAVFHARLLEGESPASALRLAQLTLLSDPSSTPFAWAPFQLFRGL